MVICKHLGKWTQNTRGTPLGNWGSLPFFPKCPFFPNAHLPISPGAHLPQVPIYFDAHLPRVLFCHLLSAHVPRCPFASSAHLPQVYVYSKFSISPNAHLPHSAHHFPKSPFAPVPIFSKCPFAPSAQFSGTQMSGTQHLSGTNTV